ncbi:purine phosphoribosyltransferase family protein Apf [Arctopsyche grandis]|uniref:purine phosphoribosyltransferase family protein Apf n=1 Tax=Arctopsyche grandis TaxID=121162 RepID=UPI00406D7DD4
MLRATGFVIFRVLDENIQYLLLRASYGDRHWTPPKGHVDPGESDFITALRETKEEAGLDESDLEIFENVTKTLEYKVKNKNKNTIYWLAKLRDPQKPIILSEEHTELRWLKLTEAQELAGHKDFNELLNEFHTHATKCMK